MNRKDVFEWGRVIKTHGLKGQLLIVIDADNLSHYENLGSVLIQKKNGQLVDFHIEEISIKSNGNAYLKLESLHSIDEAQEFCGCKLYLPIDELPSLEEGKVFFHDLVGSTIINVTDGKEIGTVESISDMPGQTMLNVRINGRSVLIPYVPEFFPEVDIERKLLKCNLPEGLLDLNS
ncbi:MAG TPA: ribosome maturation factor RimM [Bacteroidia bacterium]|nr:ribosome maturation factor RimM [Bacteroidia bacterium]HNT81100.1 ribosome maturation factor RimM [Bacteroidia bacterium]